MTYIPYYYDGDVQIGMIIFWVIVGLAAVVLGRRAALSPIRLKRRATLAAACAFGSILLYSVYILQRQTVENAHHMTFGKPQQTRSIPK